MRKQFGLLAMAASLMGLSSAANESRKQFDDLNDSQARYKRYLVSSNILISPKQFGMSIQGDKSHLVKRKTRSRKAYGLLR